MRPEPVLEITPVLDADLPELVALARAIWYRHYPDIISVEQIEYMLAQRYHPAVIRAQIASDHAWWDKLTANAEMVAFSSCELSEDRAQMKLDKLYVRYDLRGHGYGSRLIRNAEARARAAGCSRLYLQVNKNNRSAIEAYQRNGFVVEREAQFDIGNGFIMDDYVMTKSIGSQPTMTKAATLNKAQPRVGVSTKLRFTKMQGVGNDFVVIDAIGQRVELDSSALRRLADRHFGIGCDQILLIERPRSADTDFYYRVFNADGGEVQHCGNGARCFLRYVREKGLTNKREIRVETLSGIITPRLEADGQVSVDMGPPIFAPAKIPFVAEREQPTYLLDVEGIAVEISALSMGNPHAVQVVDDIERAPVATQGPLIERHARFPQRVNAGYMQIVDTHRIRLRVYERGAGETLACGTGACAAVVAGISRAILKSPVTVETRGGSLTIAWQGPGRSVMMSGPAQTVFEGEIELEPT